MLFCKRFRLPAVLLLIVLAVIPVQAAPPSHETRSLAPTYRIFATREGLVGQQTANGHIIQPRDRFVALPSWRNLSSYQGYEYQVRLTYNGRTTVVPVWDVGPWNTNDNYWSPNRDNYRDLPVGVPMAQAAYLDGYNGGLDEFGRRIQAPNGIDIADGTFWDDLGMTRNDWVDVTFLWLGEDPGPGRAIPAEPVPVPDQPANPAPAPDTDPAPGPVDNPRVPSGATAVDNGASGYDADGDAWETANCGLNGSHDWVAATTDPAQNAHSATWSPELTRAGFYEVQVYIPPCGGEQTTDDARYEITHAGGTVEMSLDQAAQAGSWASLGTYRFERSGGRIELSNRGPAAGMAVHFDAIAWLPVTDNGAPDALITNIIRQGNGYLIQWGGEDDVSGIDSYDVQLRQLPKGGWRDWKRETGETEDWFGPDEGKHFAFRARGRDGLGNEEPWPDEADMDTTQAEIPEGEAPLPPTATPKPAEPESPVAEEPGAVPPEEEPGAEPDTGETPAEESGAEQPPAEEPLPTEEPATAEPGAEQNTGGG